MTHFLYKSLIFIVLAQLANKGIFAQTTTTTHTRTTKKTTVKTDGAVVAYSYSDSNSDDNEDNSNGKYDTIEKSYSIEPGAPIFIESKMRNLKIESWDGNEVKIVARYKYSNPADRNLDLDSIFQKNNIQIKSSKNAFQILASSTVKNSYSFNDDNQSDEDDTDTSDLIRESEKLKSESTRLRAEGVKLRAEGEKMRQWGLKAQQEAFAQQSKTQTWKISKSKTEEKAITAKIKKLSEELAIAAKHNESDKIEKLSQEIGNLSGKLAAQSLAGSVIVFDTKNDMTLQADSITFDFTPPTPPTPPTVSSFSYSGPSIAVGKNSWFGSSNFQTNETKEWTIYIPKNHKLSIENKYGNIKISNDLENVKIENKYGNVTTENLKNLQLDLDYGNYAGGNIDNADITINSGKIKAQNIVNLKLNSKYSTIDLEDVENANINSVSDNVDVNAFQNVQADKNYGSFRIASLGKTLKLSGSSADLKIRNLAPTVTNIDIDNKYANIAIPMDDAENYSVIVNGSFNTSNDNFTDKKQIGSDKNSNVNFIPLKNSLTNQNTKVAFSSKDGGSYEVQKGNANQLKINLNCTSCTIDFK